LSGIPAVASDAAGNFVIVWSADFGYGIMGRRYDASGVAQGGPFVVNSDIGRDQVSPSVALNAHGGFVVAWRGPGDEDALDVFARTFDASGPIGLQFRVDAVAEVQAHPSVTSNAGTGDFVIAWQSSDAFGSYDIFAQRFLWDLLFRDDFES